jgi:hypothetical protein
MISATFNTTRFNKEMNNIIKYSEGFLDGIKMGKTVFLRNLGVSTVQALKEYIDEYQTIINQLIDKVNF